jgi:hypothetical protein
LTLPPSSTSAIANPAHRGQLEVWPWVALGALALVVLEWLAFHRGL